MHTSEKISLLIRHADRDQFPPGSFGNEVLLNEKGKINALQFGQNLSGRIIHKIFTSPVLRSVQTAEFMAKGYGREIEIVETTALGAPGLHISDDKKAGEYLLRYGFDETYKRFTNGEKIPGIPDINELHSRITNYVQTNSDHGGTTIFITHDMLIAFYHFSVNKRVYSKDRWINFLTGLTFKDDQIYEG